MSEPNTPDGLTLDEVKNGDYPDRDDRAELLDLPNVTGHGIGYREVDGELTDEVAVRVYVDPKVPDVQLTSDERVPTAVGDIQTDVVEREEVTPDSAIKGSRANVMRPVMGGLVSSTSSRDGQGSLGGFFYSPDHDQYVGVHCRHVFRESDDFSSCIGETTYQPIDVESESRDIGDVIAETDASSESNRLDAVYFGINDTDDISRRFPGGGDVVDIQDPQLGVRIQGSGARTGVTGGRIVALDVTNTNDGNEWHGYAEYTTDKAGGDSGALMGHITENGNMVAIGIHVASTLLGTPYIVPFSEMEANSNLGSLEPLPGTMDTHDDFDTGDDGFIECHPRHVDQDSTTGEYTFDTFVTNTGGSTRTDTVELYGYDSDTDTLTELQSHSVTLDPAEWTTIEITETPASQYDEWLIRTTDQDTAFTDDDISSSTRYLGVEMADDTEIYPTSISAGTAPPPATATTTSTPPPISARQITTVTATPTATTDTAPPPTVTPINTEHITPSVAGAVANAHRDITTTAVQTQTIAPPPATTSDSTGGPGGDDTTEVTAEIGRTTVEVSVHYEKSGDPVDGATVHVIDRDAHAVLDTLTTDETGYASVTIAVNTEVQLVAEYHDGTQAYQAHQHTAYGGDIDEPFQMRLYEFEPNHANVGIDSSVPVIIGVGEASATASATPVDAVQAVPIYTSVTPPTPTGHDTTPPVGVAIGTRVLTTPVTTTATSPDPTQIARVTTTPTPPPASGGVATEHAVVNPIHVTIPTPTGTSHPTAPTPGVLDRNPITITPTDATTQTSGNVDHLEAVSPIATKASALEARTTTAEADPFRTPDYEFEPDIDTEPNPANQHYHESAATPQPPAFTDDPPEIVTTEDTSAYTPLRTVLIDGDEMGVERDIKVSATEFGYALCDLTLYNLDLRTWESITRDSEIEIRLGWGQGIEETVFRGPVVIKRRRRRHGNRAYVIRAKSAGAQSVDRTIVKTFRDMHTHRIVETLVTDTPQLSRGYIGTGTKRISGGYTLGGARELTGWLDKLASKATSQTGERWVWYLSNGKLYFHSTKQQVTDHVGFSAEKSILRATPTGTVGEDRSQQSYEVVMQCEPTIRRGMTTSIGGFTGINDDTAFRVASFIHNSSTSTGKHRTTATFAPLFKQLDEVTQ